MSADRSAAAASTVAHAFSRVFALLSPHLAELDVFLRGQLAAFEPEIREMADYCIDTSGKRIRPALVFLSGWRGKPVLGSSSIPAKGMVDPRLSRNLAISITCRRRPAALLPFLIISGSAKPTFLAIAMAHRLRCWQRLFIPTEFWLSWRKRPISMSNRKRLRWSARSVLHGRAGHFRPHSGVITIGRSQSFVDGMIYGRATPFPRISISGQVCHAFAAP